MLRPPTKKRRELQSLPERRALFSFYSFLSTIHSRTGGAGAGTVGIFHHTDSDGMSSGILLQHLVQHATGIIPQLYPTEYSGIQEGLPLLHITTGNLTHALFVDLAIDEQLPFLKKLDKIVSWYLIDHHELYHDRPNILKPQKFTTIPGGSYPCAKLVYDIAPPDAFRGKEWLACIGIIGDMGMKQWEPFLAETYKKNKWKIAKNYYDTILGTVCKMITSVEATKSLPALYHLSTLLSKSKSPNDIIKSSALKKIHNKVDKEINGIVKGLSSRVKGKSFYAEIDSPYNIKGPVSTLFSLKHPSTTIFLANKEENTYRISGRRQDGKEAVSTILRTAVKGIPGAAGGGHPQAAGATVPEQHYELFKRRIFAVLKLPFPKK